jgi:hypothetical protein
MRTNPVLMAAVVDRCDVLLTLRRHEFRLLLGQSCYGVFITTAEEFAFHHGLTWKAATRRGHYRGAVKAWRGLR